MDREEVVRRIQMAQAKERHYLGQASAALQSGEFKHMVDCQNIAVQWALKALDLGRRLTKRT